MQVFSLDLRCRAGGDSLTRYRDIAGSVYRAIQRLAGGIKGDSVASDQSAMMGQRLRGHRKIVSGRHSSFIRHAVASPQRDLATRIDLTVAILADGAGRQ